MSLKHIDVEQVMRRLADRRVEEAMAEGKFDNLPGAGKPIDLDPAPAEEDARLLWWALRILRNNDVIPEEVQWRKRIDLLKGELGQTTDERRARTLCAEINVLVRRVNTLGTNALNRPACGVELETELEQLRDRQASIGR